MTLGEVKFVDMEQDLIAGFRKEQSRKKVEFEVRVFMTSSVRDVLLCVYFS